MKKSFLFIDREDIDNRIVRDRDRGIMVAY
jgi:hypothetical protein